jgi:hypothetical protein
MGWRAGVALVAGVLTFAGGRTLAEDARMGDLSTGSGMTRTGGGEASARGVGGETASSASATHDHELTGRVESFDRSQNTLTISGTELEIDSSTEVMRDGTRASISDIKEGDQVRASFTGSGDTAAARRIEVMTQGASGSEGSGTRSGPGAASASGSGVGPGSMSGSSGSQGASGLSDRPTSDPGRSTGASRGSDAAASSGTGSGGTGGKVEHGSSARGGEAEHGATGSSKPAKEKDATPRDAAGESRSTGASSDAHDVPSKTSGTVGGGK